MDGTHEQDESEVSSELRPFVKFVAMAEDCKSVHVHVVLRWPKMISIVSRIENLSICLTQGCW